MSESIKNMKSKYLDLHTGEVISAKQLLAFETGKDEIWKAADELRSLLVDIAQAREVEAQELLMEAHAIRDCVKKYDAAEEKLDGSEGGHHAPERQSVTYVPPDEGNP
jgi:uncharacterized protein YPO0396